ncbi:hypothetical protein CYMTET_19465 [Cymbomonas tetramitiformis]|uniref:Uncharacterized protein n=1 Tax=Cymbomonas tetramitiformis TaxID=36881 RepID=A0AAE0L4V0_9CHLO|nr:hypothetical protein CYMTET_19465 [Cymbomonas tetramitiformis]
MPISLKRKNASGVKEGDFREQFKSLVAAVGGDASDENFIKWLVARDGWGGEGRRWGQPAGGAEEEAVKDGMRLPHILLERLGVYSSVAGRGTGKGKWVWHPQRTAHPYYKKHTDAIKARVIETDARTKYPTHEEKRKAFLTIEGLVLHELPAVASDALTAEHQDELGEEGGGAAVAEAAKGKGKAVSASEDPTGKGKAVAASEDKGPTDEKEDGSADESEVELYEVGDRVVLYCVVESLVSDPRIKKSPRGFTMRRGSHLPGCAWPSKDDLPFENAPMLLSAWQNGMNQAFVGTEMAIGKSLKGNDKMAGLGGIGARPLSDIEDKVYAFGAKSKWSLVLPYSHLRPIDEGRLDKVYECAQPDKGDSPSGSQGSG